jgi:two-component system nitrate/nitrite response regulator NarL
MRILLIDDHALFRIGLQELLARRGIEVVAAEGDCELGIHLASEESPDVILLDMRMPKMSGIEVLKRLRQAGLEMPIAMLTTSTERQDLLGSLQHGAQGYLLKDMEPDDLIRALVRIVGGETVVAEELEPLLEGAGEPAAGNGSEGNGLSLAELTQREGDILCLLAEGQSNKAIARYLDIREDTVKKHVQSIMRKLAVKSRVEAAVIAVERNLCANRKGAE